MNQNNTMLFGSKKKEETCIIEGQSARSIPSSGQGDANWVNFRLNTFQKEIQEAEIERGRNR